MIKRYTERGREDINGEFVRYNDHIWIIKSKDAMIKLLKNTIIRIQKDWERSNKFITSILDII